jgi:UDP-GlcNAc:undecaprenyl-phosphate GlcNAc-1-phosphate transferase
VNAFDLSTLLAPALLALTTTPLVISWAWKARILDQPGPERIHTDPVPTLGGLSLVLPVLLTLWVLEGLGRGLTPPDTLALTLAAVPVAFVGILDDLAPRGIVVKLSGQIAAGLLLYFLGVRVSSLTNPFGDAIPLGSFALPVTLLFVVAIVNALNLVDGLDGLACGIAAIAAFCLSLVGDIQGETNVRVLGLVLAGAAIGFFPFNFPKARIFLGDLGSTFLGLALATLALVQNRKTTATLTLLVPIVALGLPVLDTAFAIVRRAANGRSPFRRDLGHMHHRLIRIGLSPRRAVLTLLAVTACFGTAAVFLAALPKQEALVITFLVGLGGFGVLLGLLKVENRVYRTPREGRILQKV